MLSQSSSETIPTAAPAGKQRSSLQATRHPATGQVVVLPQPDLAACHTFIAQIVAAFQPAGAHESQLAHSYASLQWRLNRAAAVEDGLFTLGLMEEVAENLNIEHPEAHNATAFAKTFRNDPRAFDRLGMYTQRLVNSAAKILRQLEDAQARRRERDQQELAQAAQLYQFHVMQNQAFDPQENGFHLSTGQIRTHIQRTKLHNHAQLAEQLDFDRAQYQQKYGSAAA